MRICILATAENVDTVRETARQNLPEFANHRMFDTPVSADGTMPATHWLCHFKVSQGMVDKLMALKNLSDMEVATPSEFLSDRNLKIIGRGEL